MDSPHQGGTFVVPGEPTLTHPYHPKSMIDWRVHSRRWTLYGFGQMGNVTYPSFEDHTG